MKEKFQDNILEKINLIKIFQRTIESRKFKLMESNVVDPYTYIILIGGPHQEGLE